MTQPVWVLPEVASAIHQILITEHGGLAGIRDEALFESSLARPKQLFTYKPDVSLFELAACYSYGLCRNHPFIDGNKRTALTIGATFLLLNGYSLNAPEAETVIMFQQLAAGEVSEANLAEWIQDHANVYTE